MYSLYYYPGNANIAPHAVLEAIGADYELIFVDRPQMAHRTPEYLALNPNGRIPVLVDHAAPDEVGRPLVLYEAAGICLYLLETSGDKAGLLPPVGSRARGLTYTWLMWLTNTVQTDILAWYYTDRFTEDPTGVDAVKAAAGRRLGGWIGQMDARLAETSHLAGPELTVADLYAAMVCRWARVLPTPPRSLPHLGPYLDRMEQVPCLRRAYAQEGIAEPYLG